jgi:hypothetical protein
MRQIACSLGLAALLLLPGCFVLDEMDAGMAKMKENSPGAKAEAGAAAEGEAVEQAPARKDGKPVDLAAWWKSARTPSSGPKEPGESIEIVSCRIGGDVRFMARTDCEVQGGTF